MMWIHSALTPLLVVMAFSFHQSLAANDCYEDEKRLALLDLTRESILKAKDRIPVCAEIAKNVTQSNSSSCGVTEKACAYLDAALTLIEETSFNHPTCDFRNVSELDNQTDYRPVENYTDYRPAENHTDYPLFENYTEYRPAENHTDCRPFELQLARNCLDIQRRGLNSSGIYTIWPRGSANQSDSVDVFCDMDTDGGGWTVIQRRGNFSDNPEDFFRDWETYKNGFGNVTRDFWIGNENIFALTNNSESEVRFDLMDRFGEHRYAVYSPFRIDGEDDNYRLHVGNYSGNAGDTLTFSNGMAFSTHDNRNDRRVGPPSCSFQYHSGWWFRDCTLSNPNGRYQPDHSGARVIFWTQWKQWECLVFVEIKVRDRRMH